MGANAARSRRSAVHTEEVKAPLECLTLASLLQSGVAHSLLAVLYSCTKLSMLFHL